QLRLGVEQIDVAGAAVLEELDDGAGPRGEVRAWGGRPRGPGPFLREQGAQRQAGEARGGASEPVAAAEGGGQVLALRRGGGGHGRLLRRYSAGPGAAHGGLCFLTNRPPRWTPRVLFPGRRGFGRCGGPARKSARCAAERAMSGPDAGKS